MCVRDFIRKRCPGSKKTSRTRLRQSDCHRVLCKSLGSREQRSQRPEAVDLFCPELLPMLAEVSDQSTDQRPLESPMSPNRTTAAALDGPSTSSVAIATSFPKSPSDYNHYELNDGLWDDIDHMSRILNSAPCVGDGSKASTGVDCRLNFCPDPGSNAEHGAVKGRACEIEKAESYISLGNSHQSNNLPFERRPIQQPSGCLYGKVGSSSEPPSTARRGCNGRQTPNPLTLFTNDDAPGEYACPSKFGQAMELLLEKETAICYQLSKPYIDKLTENCAHKIERNELRAARRRIVKWMFEVVRFLQLSSLAAAHAVSFLDRYLSQRFVPDPQVGAYTDIRLAATACIWIAAKLEDSGAPDLSSMRGLSSIDYDEDKIRKMEVSVLKCLGWRMLAVTAFDFVASMVAQLPAFGLPSHLLRPVGHRSEEIIQGILSEVEFLAYQPSVVSISVMQCLLDECVPLHTASIMAAFHLALAIDVTGTLLRIREGGSCSSFATMIRCLMNLVTAQRLDMHRKESEKVHCTLVDLVVDPDLVCSLPSPDRVDCASSEEVRNGCFQWTSSNDDVSYQLYGYQLQH